MQRIGKELDRTARVVNASLDQGARHAATQYKVKAQNLARELMSNPNNLHERQELFDKGKKRIRKEFNRGTLSRSVFDREAGVIDEQIGGALAHETRKEGIGQAQASLADTLDALADEWAQASGEEGLQVTVDARASAALMSAFDSGIADEDFIRDAERRYHKRQNLAIAERLIREDPEEASMILSQPQPGLAEFERERLRTRASKSYIAKLKAERLSAKDAAKALEDAEKESAEQAELRLLELDASGDLEIEHVAQASGVVGSARSRIWLDRARKGPSSPNVDPDVYVALDTQARSGLDVREDAKSAYLRGDLTKSAYDDLLDDAQRIRFGDARKRVVESLKLDNAILDGNAAAAAKSRLSHALRTFDAFRLNNEDATREESFAIADQLVAQATVADLSEVAIFNLTPQHLVRVNGLIDEDATNLSIEDSGLNEDQKELEFQALERLLELERRRDAAGAN